MLKDSFFLSETSKKDLSELCDHQIRLSEERAMALIAQMKEVLSFEREQILSECNELAIMTNEVQLAASFETQREIQRLRDEVFKARRNETLKDRELSFLQRQLIEAADKISSFSTPANSS
jgi:hypothetical protein